MSVVLNDGRMKIDVSGFYTRGVESLETSKVCHGQWQLAVFSLAGWELSLASRCEDFVSTLRA